MPIPFLISAVVGIVLSVPQTPPSSLTFENLRASVAPAPPPPEGRAALAGVQELVVTWTAPSPPPSAGQPPAAPPNTPANQFGIARRRVLSTPLHVDRNPELSSDRLVAVGANDSGAIVFWTIFQDPRVVRSEQPRPDGVLAGTVLTREPLEMLIDLPDSPEIVQAGIYQPRWTGTDWVLTLLGTFRLPR